MHIFSCKCNKHSDTNVVHYVSRKNHLLHVGIFSCTQEIQPAFYVVCVCSVSSNILKLIFQTNIIHFTCISFFNSFPIHKSYKIRPNFVQSYSRVFLSILENKKLFLPCIHIISQSYTT